jgi:NAD(P)-dependent dehydrogenase (short-subunit alcohol dehydrogenase family)
VSAHSSEIQFQKCDVTSWKDLAGLNTASLKHFSSVPDVYVPCAGIFEPPWSNFWDDAEEQGYKTMEINANHPIKMTRLAIRALLGADKKGVVCLVASGAGLGGFYLASLYCASKAAVVGFAKSMGMADQEEGVKVVCICPG